MGVESFGAKYLKAVECLVKDKDDLFAFYYSPRPIGSI